jgi:hypothetical protein
MIAAVDGMRFVVPVPAVFARPNPQVLRSQTLHDVAERDERAGHERARKSWRDRAGLPAHGPCNAPLGCGCGTASNASWSPAENAPDGAILARIGGARRVLLHTI